jgi:hypothetical protein
MNNTQIKFVLAVSFGAKTSIFFVTNEQLNYKLHVQCWYCHNLIKDRTLLTSRNSIYPAFIIIFVWYTDQVCSCSFLSKDNILIPNISGEWQQAPANRLPGVYFFSLHKGIVLKAFFFLYVNSEKKYQVSQRTHCTCNKLNLIDNFNISTLNKNHSA